MSSPFPKVRLRYLAEFNPAVPAHIRQSRSTERTILPMDDVHEFNQPGTGSRRPTGELLTGYSYVEPTDVAYAKVTPCFENGKGLIGSALPGPVFATSEITVLRPAQNMDQRFLSYVLRSSEFRSPAVASMTGAGGLRRVSESEMKDLPLPAPAPDVQRRIADYLDHETAEIDALLSEQLKFAGLLHEQWVASLITAVQLGVRVGITKISTSVKTWPVAPEGWTPTRLKSTVLAINNGSWGADPDGDEVTRRCIRVADFEKTSGRVHDRNITSRSYPSDFVGRKSLQTSDLIIEKSGGGSTTPVGNVVLYKGSGGDMYSNFVARIRLRPEIDPLYSLYLHRSLYLGRVTERSIKQTTGIQNLDTTSYLNESIFLPSFPEQVEIGRHVEALRNQLEESLELINRSTELAKERRAALISAAVTGQINVTGRRRRPSEAERLEDELSPSG